jgi:hypothetical protein
MRRRWQRTCSDIVEFYIPLAPCRCGSRTVPSIAVNSPPKSPERTLDLPIGVDLTLLLPEYPF